MQEAALQPFALEKAYRHSYSNDLLDLSSSSPMPPALGDLLDEAGRDVLAQLRLGYSHGGGSPDLRATVAGLYRSLSPDDVLITAGATEAIRAATMGLVERGQRVLVQEPSYSAISQAIIDAGGLPVPWRQVRGPGVDLGSLPPDAPRLAFLNSPHGPTGSVAYGLEHYSGRLIVDEVYRPIELIPGTLAPSCVEDSPTAMAIGDLSKPLGLGGLRIGWIATRDTEVRRRCADALDYLSGSVSTLSAEVALQAIPRLDELIEPYLRLARQNLSSLAAFVEKHRTWLDWLPPQAGYTACIRLRGGPPPEELFANLRRKGVFLLRGDVLGMPDCLRIALGLPAQPFQDALTLLSDEIKRLPRPQRDECEAADIVLFTKLPRPGQGKSRLARDIGVTGAASLAGAFLEDSARIAAAEAARLYVAIDPANESSALPAALSGAMVFPQSGAGMGERLGSAFERAFALGARNPVLIGSDSPTLPGHLLRTAHRALEDFDAVIGPAQDGGYYAIGLTRPQPALFDRIDWSTDLVLAQTIDRAREAGLRVFYLPYWHDVDMVDDLALLRRTLEPGSATEQALRELGLHG